MRFAHMSTVFAHSFTSSLIHMTLMKENFLLFFGSPLSLMFRGSEVLVKLKTHLHKQIYSHLQQQEDKVLHLSCNIIQKLISSVVLKASGETFWFTHYIPLELEHKTQIKTTSMIQHHLKFKMIVLAFGCSA